MKDLFDKKPKEGKMDDKKIQAKMEVLQELVEMCQNMMAEKFKGGMDGHMSEMQKVSVMAPDQEALLEGLEKAEDVVENSDLSPVESEVEKDNEEPKSVMSSPDKIEEKQPKKRKLFSMDDDEDEM